MLFNLIYQTYYIQVICIRNHEANKTIINHFLIKIELRWRILTLSKNKRRNKEKCKVKNLYRINIKKK